MMWWNRRLWLLLSAVFLLRDTEGLGVWNAMAKLPYQTKMKRSSSSVVSMKRTPPFPQQVLESSRTLSSCVSDTQMASLEAQTASGSTAYHQSVPQTDQPFPGFVSQTQLQGSSSNVQALFQGHSSTSVLGTPQISSSFFQQGVRHQGSSGSISAVSSAEDFPRWSTGSRVQTTPVHSTPTYQGGYVPQSSGLLKKPQPSSYVPSPLQSQNYPPLPPSQTRLVGKHASQTKTGDVFDSPSQSSYAGQYTSSRWPASQPVGQSPSLLATLALALQGSSASSALASTSGHALGSSSPSSGGLPSQTASTWWTSNVQHAQSQSQSSSAGEPSVSQQSGRDAPQTSSSGYPASSYSQYVSTRQSSSHDQPAGSQTLGSSVSSCGNQKSAMDAAQQGSSTSHGAPPPWVVSTWKVSNMPSAQSQKQSASAGLTPNIQPHASDLPQTDYSGPHPAQGASKWQPSSRPYLALQTAQTHMQGSSVSSGLTSASQQFASDSAQGSSAYWVHPRGESTWQMVSKTSPVQHHRGALTTTSQQSGMDVPQKSSGYSQGVSVQLPSSRDQTAPSQTAGSSVSSCSRQQSARDTAQSSTTSYGASSVPSVQTWVSSVSSGTSSKDAAQSSTSYEVLPSWSAITGPTWSQQPALKTGLSQMDGSSVISDQPYVGGSAQKISSYYGSPSAKGCEYMANI
ncbi:uncharacterized protein LOC143475614 isoform X2 [Brachyhypopomus gauderio]|uniref:uncharacterized protein LOC143475614 isoform X2 n=1 Tax=Brachyhypopomus gauderio TaxID=698409 RepID=UPI004041FD35